MSSLNEKEADIDSDEEEELNKKKQEDEIVQPQVEEDTTLANPDVITKYQEAAKIAQSALGEIIDRVILNIFFIFILLKCVVGAKIVDICKFGDEYIEQVNKFNSFIIHLLEC